MLIEQSAQADRIDSKTRCLWPHVGCLVESSVGVEVRMAVKAGHTQALIGGLTVLGLIELLLWEWREEETQALG